jgi:hypothetical protein
MKWKLVPIISLVSLMVLHSIERVRQKEIVLLVAIIRSDIVQKRIFHGTPPAFSLGFRHPCFIISSDDPSMIAANLLKKLSSTVTPAIALKSTDKNQRFLGAIALSELELTPNIKTEAIPSLRLALKDSDPEIRNLAITALSRLDTITVNELRSGLHDPRTQITAARAAIDLGSKARPVVQEVLKFALYKCNVCPYVTIKIVKERIGIEPAMAVFVFRQGLKYPDHIVRTVAINELAEMGSIANPAISDLKTVIANKNETELHDSAVRAIQCIKGRCPPEEGG